MIDRRPIWKLIGHRWGTIGYGSQVTSYRLRVVTVGAGKGTRNPHRGRTCNPQPVTCNLLEEVAQLQAFSLQVFLVVLIRRGLDRKLINDVEAVAFQANHFLWVVRQEPDLPHTNVD
jgi:hypothetical protein